MNDYMVYIGIIPNKFKVMANVFLVAFFFCLRYNFKGTNF